MPATKADVEELRGILRYFTAQRQMTTKERMLFDALTRAIALLNEGLATSITTYILSALRDSGHWNAAKTIWFVDDQDLYVWAMTQITETNGDG